MRVIPKNTTKCPWSELEPRPLAPESCTINMRPLYLYIFVFLSSYRSHLTKELYKNWKPVETLISSSSTNSNSHSPILSLYLDKTAKTFSIFKIHVLDYMCVHSHYGQLTEQTLQELTLRKETIVSTRDCKAVSLEKMM